MHTATATNEASGLPFEEADEMMKDIKDELVSRQALTADHEDIERLIAEKTTTLTRALMQAHLDLRAAKERAVAVEGADGIARNTAWFAPVRAGRCRALRPCCASAPCTPAVTSMPTGRSTWPRPGTPAHAFGALCPGHAARPDSSATDSAQARE